jgi:hypothetical protein
MASQADKLTTEEHLILTDVLTNPPLINALRKILGYWEREKLEAMRAEAVGQGRASEVIKFAAESRAYAELEANLKRGMERLAPQRR